MKTPKTYNYDWNTAEELIANINTVVNFPSFGVTTLAKKTGVTDPKTYRKAHEVWLKLKDAFNAEAATYEPEAYESELGSIGPVEKREVLRNKWWTAVSNLAKTDYADVTRIIEVLHDSEKLETGRIYFGS